ncbi:MAG TPA: hypothetical protein VMF11_06550 [Candidatus Baltobacteraceae bacterium]|nr:hypothetical protein [Candidatus Baltobacteraceae bacterium]
MASIRVTPFSAGGKQDVIRQFLGKDAKRLPGVATAVFDALRVLELTPQVDLKAHGCLSLLRDGVWEVRVEKIPAIKKPKDHWVRLFVAYYPTGIECVVLLVKVKKTNKIDPDDTNQAIRNLGLYKRQRS